MASKAKSREPRVKSREPGESALAPKLRVVLQLPAACPGCGSTKLAPIAGAKPLTREIAGEIKGVKHQSVRWQHCACADCGQVLCVRVYLH